MSAVLSNGSFGWKAEIRKRQLRVREGFPRHINGKCHDNGSDDAIHNNAEPERCRTVTSINVNAPPVPNAPFHAAHE